MTAVVSLQPALLSPMLINPKHDQTKDGNVIDTQLVDFLHDRGASQVRYADLSGLPDSVTGGMPRGVSIAVALDPGIVRSIAEGPTPEYSDEYDRVNTRLNSLAKAAITFLAGHGYAAAASASTVGRIEGEFRKTLRTVLPHKTVATRAGMGWIGKNALLISKSFGSAMRITSVLTDAPFECGEPVDESLCGSCTACVDVCPAGAPSGIAWNVMLDRDEFFDVHACYGQTKRFKEERGYRSNICGMCIAACPWTQRYLRTADAE